MFQRTNEIRTFWGENLQKIKALSIIILLVLSKKSVSKIMFSVPKFPVFFSIEIQLQNKPEHTQD